MLTIAEMLSPEVVEDLREMEDEILEEQEYRATDGFAVYTLEELEERDMEIREEVSRYPAKVWGGRFSKLLQKWTATEMLLDRQALARAYLLEAFELDWVNDQLQKKAKGEEAEGRFGPTGGRAKMESFRKSFGAKLSGKPSGYARNFFKVSDGDGTFQDDEKVSFRPGWEEAWQRASEEAAVAQDIQAISVWIDGLSEEDRSFFLETHLSPKFNGLWIAPEIDPETLAWWDSSSEKPLPRFVEEERPKVDAQLHDFVVKKTGYDLDRTQAPEDHLPLLARANLSGYHIRRKDSSKTVGLGLTRQDLSKACLWKLFDIKQAVSNWVKHDLANIKKARERKEVWQPIFEAAKVLYREARTCKKPRKASEPERMAARVVFLFDTTTTIPKDKVLSWGGFAEAPKEVPLKAGADLEKVKSAVFAAKKEVKEETWGLLDTITRGFQEAGACIAKRQATEVEALAAAATLCFCQNGVPATNLAFWGGFDGPAEARKAVIGKGDPEELRKVVFTARKVLKGSGGNEEKAA